MKNFSWNQADKFNILVTSPKWLRFVYTSLNLSTPKSMHSTELSFFTCWPWRSWSVNIFKITENYKKKVHPWQCFEFKVHIVRRVKGPTKIQYFTLRVECSVLGKFDYLKLESETGNFHFKFLFLIFFILSSKILCTGSASESGDLVTVFFYF